MDSEPEICAACGATVEQGTTHFCRPSPSSEPYVKRPPLHPDDCPAALRPGGVVHIQAVERVDFHDPHTGRDRSAVRVILREAPRYASWPGQSSLDIMIVQLGLTFDSWIGAAVPIVAVWRNLPESGERVHRFATLPREDWEEALLAAQGVIGAQESDL